VFRFRITLVKIAEVAILRIGQNTAIDSETHLSLLFPLSQKIFSSTPRNKRAPIPFCMVYNARPSRDAFIHKQIEKEKLS
jgi:hypothetical protein